MPIHSTWGVLSQGRNSKELTARETNGGTLGFKRKQRLKPYQYLYVDTCFFVSWTFSCAKIFANHRKQVQNTMLKISFFLIILSFSSEKKTKPK